MLKKFTRRLSWFTCRHFSELKTGLKIGTSVISALGNFHTYYGVFCFCFELGDRMEQTVSRTNRFSDKRTDKTGQDPQCSLLGRPHNKRIDLCRREAVRMRCMCEVVQSVFKSHHSRPSSCRVQTVRLSTVSPLVPPTLRRTVTPTERSRLTAAHLRVVT